MIQHFPVEFTLESGIEVQVDKRESNTYEFILRSAEKTVNNFTYIDDGRPKAEWDDRLDFEQLEALRRFWLINEEVV